MHTSSSLLLYQLVHVNTLYLCNSSVLNEGVDTGHILHMYTCRCISVLDNLVTVYRHYVQAESNLT